MGLGSHQKLLQVTSVPLKPTPREPLMSINELVFVPQRSMAGLGSYSAMSVGQVKGNGPPTPALVTSWCGHRLTHTEFYLASFEPD